MSDDPFADAVEQTKSTGAPQAQVSSQSTDPFADAVSQNQQESAADQEKASRAPNWSEIPGEAYNNLGTSAGNFVRNIKDTVTHPIQTVENIGNVGHGLAQSLGVAPEGGHEDEPYWNAVKEHFKGQYGSMDNFKRSLATDPVGVASDLSMAFTGGGALLRGASKAAELANIANTATRAVGTAGKVAGGVGTALDPLTVPAAAAKGALNLTGKALTGGANLVTQTGMKPLEEAYASGKAGGEQQKAFRSSLTGETTPEEITDNAQKGINNLVQQKNLNFEQKKQLWGQSQTPLSWNDIGQAIRDSHNIQEFHGEELLDPRGAAMRKNLDNAIIDWQLKSAVDPRYATAAGFDALKKKVGNIRDAYANDVTSPEYKIASNYYKSIGDTIKKQVPEYGQAMEDYATAQDQLNQLRKTFSMPADQQKRNVDAALRKLTSTQRKNVNTNFGQRARLMDQLQDAGASNLGSQLAGQALQSTEPHGFSRGVSALLAGTGHPVEALAGMALSPRAAGEVWNRTGQLVRYPSQIPVKKALGAAQQAGRHFPINIRPLGGDDDNQQSRGGAIGRALRATKRKRNG